MAFFKREKKKPISETSESPQTQGPSSVENTPIATREAQLAQPGQREVEQPKQQPDVLPQQEQQRPQEQVAQPQEQQPRGSARTQQTPSQPPVAQPASLTKTPTRKQVESILSDGLTELYQTMTPEEQAKFRQAGEEAATSIEGLLTGFKATARKVVHIIRKWLATIPRVNQYFLEQESKIKTDEIIKMQRRLKKEKRLKNFN